MSDLKRWATTALEAAKREGVDEAEAYVGHAREITVSMENNELKTATSQEHEGLGLRVHKVGSLGFASVNQLEQAAVSEAAIAAAALAGASPPSPYNHLPEQSRVRPIPDLYDAALDAMDLSDAAAIATEALARIRELDRRVTVESGEVTVISQDRALSSSLGIDRDERSTLLSLVLLVVARDGDELSSFQYEVVNTRSRSSIQLELVCSDLVARTVASLGAAGGESFLGSVVLSPGAVAEIILPVLVPSFSAESVQKGMSRLAGKKGQEIASELLTITDDATIPGGAASRSFDREGIGSGTLTLLRSGVLESYLYNHRAALRENVASTGHAVGSYRGTPGIGPTNLIVSPGGTTKEQLIAGLGKGLLVTRFSGQTSAVSGEFSGVVKGGFLITAGKVDRPIMGTMIAGNVFDLLPKVSGISREAKWVGSACLPYVRIEDVSVTAAQ